MRRDAGGARAAPDRGHIVIGACGRVGHLAAGARIGAGGEAADLALDPLEGAGIVARGGGGAMSMIAAGPRGSFPTLPDMYMRKMAVGPVARGKIDLTRPGRREHRGDRRPPSAAGSAT